LFSFLPVDNCIQAITQAKKYSRYPYKIIENIRNGRLNNKPIDTEIQEYGWKMCDI
jgi:hypothetical protein